MTTLEILRDFGWVGILVIWTLDKFFPRAWSFLTDKVFPTRAKERAQRLERDEKDAQARREAEATLLKSRIERETRDEEHRRKIEERMVSAQELTASNIQQMTLAITVNNERLGQMFAILDKLNSFTVDAVGDMRESVIKLHKNRGDSQPKIPRVKTSRRK